MVPPAQAEQEIVSSREAIQQKLGGSCKLFSYPNGDYSEQVRKLVARAGYKFAFLNQEPGVWTRDCDPLLIPRVNVCEYHLVNARDEFSPLIFDYAVVWSAAKGLLSDRLKKFITGNHTPEKKWEQSEPKSMEESSEKTFAGK
jgi:peptidoglycan/xylan/chitin deacetylase (PgdA/CDA1 family)